MRGRSYSPSPSPRRVYSRKYRSPSPRGHFGGQSRELPTSLLVRNLRHDCRPEDLRRPFGKFGQLKDIYLPRDYYTGEPRGFGFVQYCDPADAADAKYRMDGEILLGRELTVVFAEENRKKPYEMRARDRVRSVSYDRRRSPLDQSRSPSYRRSYSRSPDDFYRRRSPLDQSRSPHYMRSYSRSPDDFSPMRNRYSSRSISQRDRRYREQSYSRSPAHGSRSSTRSCSPRRSPDNSR